MPAALIFGEVLFDQFDSGESVIGGAPLNVAWHLHAIGLTSLLVSRVGADTLGDQVKATLQQAGFPTDYLQTDPEHPTGTVRVHITDGSPSFEIVEDVAYDYIEHPDLGSDGADVQLLYHGSLALRHVVSRDSLARLREQSNSPVFVDINLRPPHWNQPLVEQLTHSADWLKINDEELATLAGEHGKPDRDRLTELARMMAHDNNLRAVIVTCGSHGAFIVSGQQVFDMVPVKPDNIVDTVGAGDGFSAMVIAGILQGQPFGDILEKASQFAARICGIRGAVPSSAEFYNDFRVKV